MTQSDAILIQHAYSGSDYSRMLAQFYARHSEYCGLWHIDYQCYVGDVIQLDPRLGGWAKIHLIREALVRGYQRVIYCDADAFVYDFRSDIRDGCPQAPGFGVTWHERPERHWNVGMLYVTAGLQTNEFIREWLRRAPGEDAWHEQRIFNTMATEDAYRETVCTIAAKWNSCYANNEVADAVVKSYHGAGSAQERLSLMREAAKC